MTSIAVYGGCFNPIHNGHLIVAEEIRQLFRLDKIIFVPAAQPPHKPANSLIDVQHRLNMVRLAIEDNPDFILSDIEISRGGTSYTIDTLRSLKRQYGNNIRLYFIVGSDAFLELDAWKQPKELFELAYFIVIERPGASINKAIDFLEGFHPVQYQILNAPLLGFDSFFMSAESKVFFAQATLANISSSGIRELVSYDKSLRYLVPDAVREYIEKNGLYCKEVSPNTTLGVAPP